MRLSPQTIDALAFVISGGSANDTAPKVGIYRTGPQLERFMRACNVDLSIGSSSRFPALVDCLMSVAQGSDADALLPTIVERAADPRDFLSQPEKLTAVVDYLNARLRLDGLELQAHGPAYRLAVVAPSD